MWLCFGNCGVGGLGVEWVGGLDQGLGVVLCLGGL